jgi:glycosyltransferase involved in cell wall biosynthesis
MPKAQFYVYSLNPIRVAMPSHWTLRTESNIIVRRLLSVTSTTMPWFRFRVGELCRSDGVSWFWGTQSMLPRLPVGVRTLITVYDLNFLLARRTMLWRSIVSQSFLLQRSLREATAISTISQGTMVRLRELLGFQANAIITPAVSSEFRPRLSDEVSECLSRYGAKPPYLLALGTWEPRKNLDTLVRTFVRMKSEGLLSKHRLILVGERGWRDSKLARTVRAAAAHDVMALGRVPDSDLAAFYTGCDAFVFPSVYEGFGIPVLEARACGARVVATDIPEIREAGGDSTMYVSPTAEGLRQGILHVLSQQKRQTTATSYLPTWEQSARALAGVFCDAGPGES